MTYSYNDCVEGGFLRRIPPSKDNASRSIEKAEKWLLESKITLESMAFNSSVIASYMVMFHSARAILFNDGWREKNHLCVSRYLHEKYVKTEKLNEKWTELLDYHRNIRHNNQYNLSFFAANDDAKNALNSAKLFLEQMKELLEKIQS
ncbi:HEPN domain-containing protein [Candidatus Dependentiae bacterium]|nr:HEPN domain-containing protein [Candidatus Dependentiae bacterium]